MQHTGTLSAEAAASITAHRTREFVGKHAGDPLFWEWLNSDAADMRLFFAVAHELSPEQRRQLSHSRGLLLDEYEMAARAATHPRALPEFSKLEEISRHARKPAGDPLLIAAAREVLTQTDPADFLDDSHAAVFLYHFLNAAQIPELTAIVKRVVAEHPELLAADPILSAAAQAYGPGLVALIADACLVSAQPESCADLLDTLIPLHREGESPADYARRVLDWYGKNRDRLSVDSQALYPAPPFAPLFRLGQVR